MTVAALAQTSSTSTTLRITEIFLSLQGEAATAGYPTVFVRLTGCPLRCQYCDTEYAFHGGQLQSLDAIVTQVTGYGVRHVTVTGGEPLAQPNVLPLMVALCDAGLQVSLETSGALDVAQVDPRVSRVVDLKTPGSGELNRNLWTNIPELTQHDQIKFVLCDRDDYNWAKLKCDELQLAAKVGQVWFSPSVDQLPARELADWIVQDRLNVRLQVQLHKLLWGAEPGR